MMEQRIDASNGLEDEAFTRARRLFGWKPGTLRDIKNRYRRRVRRVHKRDLLQHEVG